MARTDRTKRLRASGADGVTDESTNTEEPTTMGTQQATEMAQAVAHDEITERQAIVWHFRSNCFPPVPLAMVDTALEAIESVREGCEDVDIGLPDGVEFRGGTTVLPWEAIEAFHLDAFVFVDEFADEVMHLD